MVGANLELSEEVSLLKKFNAPAVSQAIQLPPPSCRSCASPQGSAAQPRLPRAWVLGSGEARHVSAKGEGMAQNGHSRGMPSDGSWPSSWLPRGPGLAAGKKGVTAKSSSVLWGIIAKANRG